MMRKIVHFSLVIMISAMSSCGKVDNPKGEQQGDEPAQEEVRDENAGIAESLLSKANGCFEEVYCDPLTSWEGSAMEVKAALSQTLDLGWEAEDQVAVFGSASSCQKYIYSGAAGGNSFSFSGPSVDRSFSNFFILYPYSDGIRCCGEGKFDMEFAPVQDYVEGVPLAGATRMIAVSEDLGDVHFRNLTSYLSLKIFGEGVVSRISVRGNKGEKIAGKVSVEAGDKAIPSVMMASEALDEVILDMGDGGVRLSESEDYPTSFMIAMAPVEFEDGITVTVFDRDGSKCVRKSKGPLKLSRSAVRPMAAFGFAPMYEFINGTAIAEGNDLVGLITDAVTGKGIAGVPVTDGYSYTKTDANGVYQMAANDMCRIVYYSLPSGYKTCMAEDNVPLFYSTKKIVKGAMNRNDFVLEPKTVNEDNWTLVGISDPQAASYDDLRRYKSETMPDIVSTLDEGNAEGRFLNPYGVTLGDIVSNAPELWPGERAAHANVRLADGRFLPIYQTIGNHDHDGGHTDYEGTQNYVDTFGPTDYSFNIGKVHVVCLDDIYFKDVASRGSYVCGFTDEQYEWVKQDFDMVEDKANTLLIVNVHAPFGDAPGVQDYVDKSMHYDDMLSLFTEFHDAHILSGHTHYAMNYVHADYRCKSGNPVYDHNEAAACGLIWRPGCDVCVDGAPMGYYIYDIEGNEIVNWRLKATRYPFEYQMRVYDGNQIWNGMDGQAYSWYDQTITSFYAKPELRNSLVVTLWDGDFVNWKLELFVGGVKYGDLEKVPGETGDIVAFAFKHGDTWGTGLLKYSQHYWYIKVPEEAPVNGEPSNLADWEVVATQVVPSSRNLTNVYRCSHLQTDFSGFILD